MANIKIDLTNKVYGQVVFLEFLRTDFKKGKICGGNLNMVKLEHLKKSLLIEILIMNLYSNKE